MKLLELTGITIPEGVVKKIERDGVTLWEKPNDLVCNPALSVAYARKYSPSDGTYVIEGVVTVTGISESLIQTFTVILQKYFPNNYKPGWSGYAPFRNGVITKIDETTFEYTALTVTVVTPNGEMRVFAELTYTDLDGNTKTISAEIPYVKTW